MSRIAVTSLVLWALAGAAYGLLRITFGERPVFIHVRWAPSVDDAARGQIEERYGLSRPEQRDGRTWSYYLTNRSRSNIEALVRDPAVEDTQNLNRASFRAGLFTPRGPYDAGSTPVILEYLTGMLLLGGIVVMFFDSIAVVRSLTLRLVAWTGGRIPAASAESVALFRIMFGIALLAIFLTRPVNGAWAIDPANEVSAPQALVLQLVTEHPWLADWVHAWLLAWGLLFVAGAFARTSFVMLTGGALLWASLYATRVGSHTISALLVTLLGLVWSRWGDAWSVDAWRRNRPPQPATPYEYGYTIWLPSLVLGVIFAAAALAKLRESGLAWILNGTVKYHFLSDSPQALVDWGAQIGRHPWLAVLLSFGAIAAESLIILGVLSRAYRYRLAAGAAALLLLLGFSLLQGIFWPAWWILLLSFLPWHLVRSTAAPAASIADQVRPVERSSLRLVHPAVILILVSQQMIASALRLEVEPLISTYGMYSTTYSGPQDYETKSGLSYWIVAVDAASATHECPVDEADAHVIARAATAAVDRVTTKDVLERCFAPTLPIRSVSVETRQVNVDWALWRLESDKRVPLTAPIPADAIR